MATKKINRPSGGNTTVGGALMENTSAAEQTAVYDINNSHYEVVRIFAKDKNIKSLIKETISCREKDGLN